MCVSVVTIHSHIVIIGAYVDGSSQMPTAVRGLRSFYVAPQPFQDQPSGVGVRPLLVLLHQLPGGPGYAASNVHWVMQFAERQTHCILALHA